MTKRVSIFNRVAVSSGRVVGRLLCLAPLAGLLAVAACTATATVQTGTCETTNAVTCQSGVAYSCTSGEPTDPTLTCSGDGTGYYCCVTNVVTTTTTASCAQDSALSCSAGSGWSCTGGARPESSTSGIVCSVDNGVGQFCCAQSSDCGYDANVAGCVTGASGFSCTSGSAPPEVADSSLVCSVPTTSGGQDLYCCYTNTTTAPSGSTCTQDRASRDAIRTGQAIRPTDFPARL